MESEGGLIGGMRVGGRVESEGGLVGGRRVETEGRLDEGRVESEGVLVGGREESERGRVENEEQLVGGKGGGGHREKKDKRNKVGRIEDGTVEMDVPGWGSTGATGRNIRKKEETDIKKGIKRRDKKEKDAGRWARQREGGGG